jgi:transposase InsO family protein
VLGLSTRLERHPILSKPAENVGLSAELKESGLAIKRPKVARLMSENGLKARHNTRFKKTTDSDHGGSVARNALDHDFTADGPDQKWEFWPRCTRRATVFPPTNRALQNLSRGQSVQECVCGRNDGFSHAGQNLRATLNNACQP